MSERFAALRGGVDWSVVVNPFIERINPFGAIVFVSRPARPMLESTELLFVLGR